MAKGILIVVWVLAIAGFFVAPETGLASIARWVFWILLGAHVIECIVFREKVNAAPGSMASKIANTLVFGVLYLQTLPDPAASGD
ncbi:MAG: hypothetical protein VCB42_01765 [Myxococcota bacterium]